MFCLIATRHASASKAAAALMRCPDILFVELTGISEAAAPKASRMAPASAASPTGVPAACALM